METFRPGISSYAEWKISTAATNRIYGRHPWPKIEHINAWMVTAETDKFMAIGGLGKVAADLPNSFNKRFKNRQDKMINITPMYTDSNRKIIHKENKLYYQYEAKKVKDPKTNEERIVAKQIEITPVGQIKVPIYNPSTNTKTENTVVNVYKAYTDYSKDEMQHPKNDGTYYYFLETPAVKIDENCKRRAPEKCRGSKLRIIK